MPKPEYRILNIRLDDYAFFEEFAEKLSKSMGTDLKVVQALKMAVTQYEVKNGIL